MLSTVIHKVVVLVALIGFGVVGCAAAATLTPTPRLRVVATTTQVTALVQVVAGDKIDLTGIFKANVDPHEFEPTPGDLRAIADADLILKNGLGMEGGLDDAIRNSGTKASIIETFAGVQLRKGDQESPLGDPHVWHSVPNAIIMLNNIRDALSGSDPANAEIFKANAAAYEKKLTDLDQYIMAQIVSIPAPNRKIVSDHDTFGYYADRYGLAVVGSVIPSMTTAYQPSAQQLQELIASIRAKNVKAIFTESSIPPSWRSRSRKRQE